MKFICKDGDQAIGHTDINGNPITGTIITNTCSEDVFVNNSRAANSNTDVFFPSHAHALDDGTPINFRSHTVKISASAKNKINGYSIAVNNDIVLVADEAGSNANMVSITTNVRSA